MAYLRLNRYQLELVQSKRVDGKPKTCVLHRFKAADALKELQGDVSLCARIEKKSGEKLDLAALLKRADSLRAGVGPKERQLTRHSMHTTDGIRPRQPWRVQTLPLTLPSGIAVPEEWKKYASWRKCFADDGEYAQALVALYEFSFLYRYDVSPVVYRGKPMLKVTGRNAGSGVICPVTAIISILRHGPAVTQVMFSAAKGTETFWEDAEVSCKTFSGVWLSVSDLDLLHDAGRSLEEFSKYLAQTRAWLKGLPDVSWVQRGIDQVNRGRMTRATFQRKMKEQSAPEFGASTWFIWEKAIYGLGPRRRG